MPILRNVAQTSISPTLLQALVPVFIALICQLVVNETSDTATSYPPRTFRLEDYEKPITFVNSRKIYVPHTVQYIFTLHIFTCIF